jgi:murein DD-endopeptidase MepM/ murein hydrolase activator NlpD
VVLTLVIMGVWSAGTATYFAFQDDLLTRLISRQADMQYAYEDRVAELRGQIDRLTSRQLLDQEQIEQRLEQLTRRQSSLENRTSAIAGMPDVTPVGSIKPNPKPSSRNEATAGKPTPISEPTPLPGSDRHSSWFPWRGMDKQKAKKVDAQLSRVEESLNRVEARQHATIVAMEQTYDSKAKRVRGVLAELGMDLAKLPSPPPASSVGGPFLPIAARDATAFEKQINRIQLARNHVDRLTRALVSVPLRKPLAGELEQSSGFGVRVDPFLRSAAMHSGLDFRGSTGDPVRATAAGKVESAGWSGGYGRMIEIDHGNGFSTRYGHLSEILVSEGQAIKPGQLIGRVGSTGRSTGPHLHYETRVDGDAVDPHKFLRAGARLGEKS